MLRNILILLVILLGSEVVPCMAADEPEARNWLVDRNVEFLPEGRSEKLDLYLPPDPKAGGTRPAIVVIHGGGWKFGDKADEREVGIAATLARAGYVVASINYTLATNDKIAWPTCLEDCQAAVRFLRTHADDYAIDVTRIGAIGSSAGGTMALSIGLKDDAKPSARVNAIVALYPPTNLLTTTFELSLLFGQPRSANPELYRNASPLFRVAADFPPTFLIHGTADATVPHEQSEQLAAKFKELKVPHELLLLKDATHTFKLQEQGHDLRKVVVDFFDRYLKPSPEALKTPEKTP